VEIQELVSLSDEDYDWNYVDGAATPHDDERGPMVGGPWHDYSSDNDSNDVVAVLMNNYYVEGPKRYKVEDIDWDSDEDREMLVDTYNEWLDIHMRVPIAVFSSKEQYDTWRNKYLGDNEMPEHWYTEMRVPLDNGPAFFDCQVPHLGNVDSFEKGIDKLKSLLDLQKKEE